MTDQTRRIAMSSQMLRVSRSSIRSACAVAVLTLGPVAAALGENPNPGVAPPHSVTFGHTYGGWSAEWWKWYLSIPTGAPHPAIGGDCREGQSGKVFNLAADFTGSPGVPCTIPTGKAVLFSMANIECSTVEDPPFFGADEEALRDCAACWADLIDVSSLQATLDGTELADLGAYRASSPLFTFAYPADNIFGIAGGPATGQSVSDGYWALLGPLSAGSHALSFSGQFQIPAGGACGL
jgi:hypothetical protein